MAVWPNFILLGVILLLIFGFYNLAISLNLFVNPFKLINLRQFVSNLLIIPKKSGDLRPVINLKPLNAFVQ